MDSLFLFRVGFPNNIALNIHFTSELVATNHTFIQLDSFTYTVFLCYRRVEAWTLFLFIEKLILGILKCLQSYRESNKSASLSLQNDLLSILKGKFWGSKFWNAHITCVYKGCGYVVACNLTYRSHYTETRRVDKKEKCKTKSIIRFALLYCWLSSVKLHNPSPYYYTGFKATCW